LINNELVKGVPGISHTFIGVNDIGEEGVWLNGDQTPVTWTNWYTARWFLTKFGWYINVFSIGLKTIIDKYRICAYLFCLIFR
jgi:hypothetical protein